MKFKLALLCVICPALAFSQSNVSEKTISAGPKGQIRDSWDLEFLIASEQTRNIVTNNYDGSYTKFDTSLLQKFNPDNEFRYFLSTRYIDTKASTEFNFGNEAELFLFELMYRRKNILTQSSHGFNLTAELKNYWIIDEDIRERYGYDGSFIPQIILKRMWSRSFFTQARFRRHYFNTNNQDNYTLNFEDRVYLSATNFLTRSSMLVNQIKYQHKIRKGNGLDFRFMELAEFPAYGPPDFSKVPEAKKHQEIVTWHTGVLYFLDRSNMLEVYGETKLSNTYDKREIEEIANDEFVLGTALYLTAF